MQSHSLVTLCVLYFKFVAIVVFARNAPISTRPTVPPDYKVIYIATDNYILKVWELNLNVIS